MINPKIKLPFESLITGRIWLKEFGSIEFRGYYGDFLQILISIDKKFGVDKYGIDITYMEHEIDE